MVNQNTNSFNILIVDDNSQNIQLLGNVLRNNGYQIGCAMDGAQALEILEQSDGYDLILLDINMPVLDGFATCKIIRENEKYRDVPVIFLTAYTEIDNVIKGFELGAQDYVTKPFNTKELLVRVDTHLQLKRQRDFINQMNHELMAKVDERTQELRKAYEALNQVDNLKNDFLTVISQEIRTPLNGIVGAVNLIKSQEYSATIRDLVEILDKSVSNLELFTDNAVYFTKLSDKYNPNISEFNLISLVEFALMEKEEEFYIKRIKIEWQKDAKEILVKADKDLIYKLLINVFHLFINNSKGNNTLEIILLNQNEITLKIKDSTYCLPEFLTGNFSNSAALYKNKRLGLNFFIIKQIVEIHKGKIKLHTNKKDGSEIEISLHK